MENTLNYIFTNEEKQRRQYYRLRKLIYASDLGFYLEALEDAHDKHSEVLAVLHQNRCVGGVRLTSVRTSGTTMLPMEDEGFRLKTLFPELGAPSVVYGELSRLVLLPEFRNGRVAEKIYRRVYQKCRQLGMTYLFAITPRIQARRYLLNAKQMGFAARISDTVIPTYKKEAYSGLAECLVVLEETKRLPILHPQGKSQVVSLMEL